MQEKSIRETVAGRFAAIANSDGLLDVKFALSNPREATTERVYREVEALFAAVDRGDSKPLDFSDWQQ